MSTGRLNSPLITFLGNYRDLEKGLLEEGSMRNVISKYKAEEIAFGSIKPYDM